MSWRVSTAFASPSVDAGQVVEHCTERVVEVSGVDLVGDYPIFDIERRLVFGVGRVAKGERSWVYGVECLDELFECSGYLFV